MSGTVPPAHTRDDSSPRSHNVRDNAVLGVRLQSRLEGEFLAFVTGGRKWVLIALAGIAAVGFVLAARSTDDYWSPICLKAAVGFGLFAAIQLLPVEVSRQVRILLAVVGLGLLLLAERAHDYWRALLIELGSSVGLFIGLEYYLNHVFIGLKAREDAIAALNACGLELLDRINNWSGRQEDVPVELGPAIADPVPIQIGDDEDRSYTVPISPLPRRQTLVSNVKDSLVGSPQALGSQSVGRIPAIWYQAVEARQVDNAIAHTVKGAAEVYMANAPLTEAYYVHVKNIYDTIDKWFDATPSGPDSLTERGAFSVPGVILPRTLDPGAVSNAETPTTPHVVPKLEPPDGKVQS